MKKALILSILILMATLPGRAQAGCTRSGYKIYYSTTTMGNPPISTPTITLGDVQTYSLNTWPTGTYYFVVSALYNSNTLESGTSNEVSLFFSGALHSLAWEPPTTCPDGTAISISTNYTVTSSAGSNGTITPSGSGLVAAGTTASFTVVPNAGYTAVMGGTCGGTLSGNVYTTLLVYGNCTVSASFAVITYTITSSAGSNGTISPSGTVIINYGSTKAYAITPSAGYTASINGTTCGGSLTGTTYTTGSVFQNCSVIASFFHTAVNGSCGTTNGGTFNVLPGTNLCASGTVSAISGLGPWQWQCVGLYGGTTANCMANISTYTVTGSAGANGSILPTSTVKPYGTTALFSISPDHGYNINTVTGCNGTLSGALYTTGTIVSSCTVTATFVASPAEPPASLTGISRGVRANGVNPAH